MPLTDSKIKSFVVGEKIEKKTDGGGLYLELRPPATKTFRLAFRLNKKQRIYTIGQYPTVTLAQARKKALEAKELIKQGIDPVEHDKRRNVSTLKFSSIAEEYISTLQQKVSIKRITKLNGLLKNYINSTFGNVDITAITRNDVLKFGLELDKLCKKTVANDALGLIKCIFEFAMDQGTLDSSPYSSSIKKRLSNQVVDNHPHVSFEEIQKLLHDIEETTSTEKVLIGLKLVMLLFTRAAEIRYAKWEHVNFENKTLTIPSERMKGTVHLKKSGKLERKIALSTQAVSLLKRLYEITGNTDYLLPARTKDGVISENTMNKILNNKGYKGKQDVHGLRGLASTYLNEKYPEHEKIIEKMLAHKKEQDQVKLAYDHSKNFDTQKFLWQVWGDFLEERGLKI